MDPEKLAEFQQCQEFAQKIANLFAAEGIGPAEAITALSLCLGGSLGFLAVAGSEEFAKGALERIVSACLGDIAQALATASEVAAGETVH